VIWVIATSLATVQTTVLALWLTSQLRPSPARCPSPDADASAGDDCDGHMSSPLGAEDDLRWPAIEGC
jgi:hypothetical protein